MKTSKFAFLFILSILNTLLVTSVSDLETSDQILFFLLAFLFHERVIFKE